VDRAVGTDIGEGAFRISPIPISLRAGRCWTRRQEGRDFRIWFTVIGIAFPTIISLSPGRPSVATLHDFNHARRIQPAVVLQVTANAALLRIAHVRERNPHEFETGSKSTIRLVASLIHPAFSGKASAHSRSTRFSNAAL
jgi:hypothetical protein